MLSSHGGSTVCQNKMKSNCSLYLLDQVPGVSTEWRGRTLEALDPLYGVVNGEEELEHGISWHTINRI